MERYKRLISVFALAVMVMGLAVVASAQRRNNRNNDYYGNNNYSRNLNSTIKNLKYKAKRFEKGLDRALDRSRLDGSRREDQLNRLADKFKDAVEDLDDEYDNQRDFYKSRDEAQRVLSYGTQLKRALAGARVTRNAGLKSLWRSIDNDLRILARAYNTGYTNRRGTRNNRNNRYENDRYNRNRNRNQNRNRNNRYNRNLRSTIVSLKYKSSRFENRLDRAKDNNNRRYGRGVNSSLENLGDRFNNAVKDLENDYDNSKDFNDTYNEARRVLSIGEQLDRQVSRRGISRSIRSDWSRIEQDLRTIARAYNLNYNGRNNGSFSSILRRFPF